MELMTRGQAQNRLWMDERVKRVTASKFGEVCKAKSNMEKLAWRLLEPPDFFSRATSHGKKYESVAVEKFEASYGKTQPCGVFVAQQYPWLAASPDRLIGDNAVLEVKCPFSNKEHLISHKSVPYLRLNGDTFTLDRDHDYYYQVQGQLLCTNRSMCYFCIFTLVDFQVVEVSRDEPFIAAMSSKLKLFFDNFMKRALLEKHKYHCYDRYF